MSKAISELSASVEPASQDEARDSLQGLFRFCRSFNIGSPDPDNQLPYYRFALRDLPADLLRLAVSRVCTEWRWGHKMPLPADIRATVKDEISERKHNLARAEFAASKLRRAGPRPETKAEADARQAARAQQITKTTARACRMPAAERDPTPEEMAANARRWQEECSR